MEGREGGLTRVEKEPRGKMIRMFVSMPEVDAELKMLIPKAGCG